MGENIKPPETLLHNMSLHPTNRLLIYPLTEHEDPQISMYIHVNEFYPAPSNSPPSPLLDKPF